MKKKEKHRSQPIAIQMEHVSKAYVLHHEKPTLVENIFGRHRTEKFTALDDISLTIYKGERVGLVGPNGAGKTTLLKIIAGIAYPDQGTVRTKGRIISLIELEAGFHPDLTGQENIFLNGMIIGMSREQIRRRMAAIIAFADIKQFIDAPLYTYSQGMKLRLGFAIAVHAEPDILILDEGIAVGDAKFRIKAQKKLKELFKQHKTIIIASHWTEYLLENCQTFIYLDKRVIKYGDRSVLNQLV